MQDSKWIAVDSALVNLDTVEAVSLGVREIVFHMKCGKTITAHMVDYEIATEVYNVIIERVSATVVSTARECAT